MPSFQSSRATRRVVLVAAAAFVATSLAVGVTTRGTSEPASPREVTLNAALAAFTTANAYFLKVPGIPGESLQDSHANEIDVRSVSWGLSNLAGTPSGGKFDNLVVTKPIDASSPLLMKATAAGTTLGTIVLSALKAGSPQTTYATITLTGAKARSFQQAAAPAAGFTETVGFSYATIKLTYNKQNSNGSITPITGCWNLATHVAC